MGGRVDLQEKWVEYRVTAENPKQAKFFFLTGTAPYDMDHKFQTLVTCVETILAADNIQWAEVTDAKTERSGSIAEPDSELLTAQSKET